MVSDLDLIFACPAAAVLGAFIKQGRELGFKVTGDPMVVGEAATVYGGFADVAGGPANVEGFLSGDSTAAFAMNTPEAIKFNDKVKKEYGEVADSWYTLGYIIADNLIEAFRRAGNIEDVNTVRAACPSKDMPYKSKLGLTWWWNEDGDLRGECWQIFKFESGQWNALEVISLE